MQSVAHNTRMSRVQAIIRIACTLDGVVYMKVAYINPFTNIIVGLEQLKEHI